VALLLLAVASAAPAARLTFSVDVPARTEIEVCQYTVVEVGRPGDSLAGFRVRVDGDSHHFHLFDATGVPPRTQEIVTGGVSGCIDGDVPALVAADSPRLAVRFPRNVRLPWNVRQALVMNYHVENRSDRPRRMRARVRLALKRPRPSDRLARRWGLQVPVIHVPPFSVGLHGTSTVLAEPLEFFTLTGHMHARGVFLTATRDGEPWYELFDWRHPPMLRYYPPTPLPAGTTIGVRCSYDNGIRKPLRTCADGTPCDLVAGSGVEDAMCTIAGYVLTPVSAGADTSAARDPAGTRSTSRGPTS
jgi:hypothetical protein